MKRARSTEEQIIGVLKEAEAGANTAELARKHRISEATFCNWKAKYGGLEMSEAKPLRTLEDKNTTLKRLLADTMLDNATLFMSMGPAREKITAWPHQYNTRRSHSWLGHTSRRRSLPNWLRNGLLRYALRAPLRRPLLTPRSCATTTPRL